MLTIQELAPLLIEVTAVGPQGPNAIDGFGFDIQGLTAGDVLMFGGSTWGNEPKTQLTDGGNF